MKMRSYYPVLLAVFMIGSVVSQNVDELPIFVESDNLFPPERSESNSQNEGSETTITESTQGPLEYTKSDVTASELTTEDGKIVDSTDLRPDSPVEDVVASTIMSDNENGNDEGDTESTTADANQTMSGTTISDFNDAQVPTDEASETNASKPDEATLGSTMSDANPSTSAEEVLVTTAIETTSGSTLSDELVPNDDLQVTNDAGSETFAPEPTEQTLTAEIADVLAPALASNISQITNDGGSADAESNEPSSTKADSPELAFSGVLHISDDANSEVSTATETTSTQTTLGFSTDIDELALQIEEQVTTNEVSETTVAETTQTSGSTITAEASTTLANTDEQNATTEGSETTNMENADLKSGSTIADDSTSSLTASDDQVTNNEGSETMAESILINAEEPASTATSLELSCPKPCVCITEGDSSNYIVDCSDRALTDLPGPIDPKTTTLKLQNNLLTIIPKEISQLKNLKVLNASENLIFQLELGSVSELPELVTLNLANNRLHEYPEDLQYPIAINKLEELNLSGNDLIATPKIMLNYKALQTVTLPEASSELAAELCMSLKETLITVCSKSCEEQTFKCSDAFVQTSDTLPGMIPFIPKMMDEDTKKSEDISGNTQKSDTSSVPKSTEAAAKDTKSGQEIAPVNEFSLRIAVNNAPNEKVALQSIVIDAPKDSTNNGTDVKIGAKTTETKAAGGVDKSVIAVIVAGMVIIIAIITIKKNWSSIRNRFGSTPRPNDRSVRNTNGTTPEEVPLQDKSPV